jgi:hypothetical protein
MHECLNRLGRENEAVIIKPKLDIALALALADVEIKYSCYCRGM